MSVTQTGSRVSLEDCDASPEEAEALRLWMRSDAICVDHDEDDELCESQRGMSCLDGESPTVEPSITLLTFRHTRNGDSVAMWEVERALDDPEPRYLVIAYQNGEQVDYVATDSFETAKAVLAHAAAPLPGDTTKRGAVL